MSTHENDRRAPGFEPDLSTQDCPKCGEECEREEAIEMIETVETRFGLDLSRVKAKVLDGR